MPSSYATIVFRLLLILLIGSPLAAQNTPAAVAMEIEKEVSGSSSRLVTVVVMLQNLTSQSTPGKLVFTVPSGIKNVTGEALVVALQPNESRYIPVKFLIGSDAVAGPSLLDCKFIAASGAVLAQKSTIHTIAVNNDLVLTPLITTFYRSEPHAPITVHVKVDNLGNVKQDVTVICKFPDPSNADNFIEQQGVIGVKKDSVFTFTYLPSKALAGQSRFTIGVFGLRSVDKEQFGGSTIVVQNTSSVQIYRQTDFSSFSDETQNYVTTSYRSIGKNATIFQMAGAGAANLPIGSLLFRGNIAFTNHQQDPLVTNTSLRFAQKNSEITIGSINKLLEMPLVGRGASLSRVFSNHKKIEVGFVDQNYNVAEKNSWLKNGYGFYTQALLFGNPSTRNLSAAYVYRYDPFEKAKHHVVGTELNYVASPSWQWHAKVNGGLSQYDSRKALQPSFAAEAVYSGKFKNINLNGNYYGSSDFYPGNRRGSLQVQQQLSTEVGNNRLQASLTFSNFSPRFHLFASDQQSTTTQLELGNRFPKINRFSFGLLYQYQSERSNSYAAFSGGFQNGTFQHMQAHRLVEQVAWVDVPSRQSAVFALETGLVQHTLAQDPLLQLKLNGSYGFRNFNLNTTYQLGSYYLSEYTFSRQLGDGGPYSKLHLSFFYNATFIKDKVSLNTGVAYTEDAVYGKSPSVFANAKYNGKRFNWFLNTSWYNYSSGIASTDMLTVELGLTVNLSKTVLNPNKKGTLNVLAFYDRNNNNLFDGDEQPAADFNITLGSIVLKTDQTGAASYRKVPFGTYPLTQLTQDGWFYDSATVEVDRYSTVVLIPLHQSGSIQGKVVVAYDAKTDLAFTEGAGGIAFSVVRANQIIKKIYTDDEGKFTSFLPTGTYTLLLDEKSLPANTSSATKSYEIKVVSGQILVVPPFNISVKEKKINTKKFSN